MENSEDITLQRSDGEIKRLHLFSPHCKTGSRDVGTFCFSERARHTNITLNKFNKTPWDFWSRDLLEDLANYSHIILYTLPALAAPDCTAAAHCSEVIHYLLSRKGRGCQHHSVCKATFPRHQFIIIKDICC